MVRVLTRAAPHLASDEDITSRVNTSGPWKDHLKEKMRECFECLLALLHSADSQNTLGLHLLPCIVHGLAQGKSSHTGNKTDVEKDF